MQFKDRITVLRKAAQVAIKFEFTKGCLKTGFSPPARMDYFFRLSILKKIKSMVSQLNYMSKNGMIEMDKTRTSALKNAQSKLDYAPNWTRSKWQQSIGAILPNLRDAAPIYGKYADGWSSLIDALDCIAAEEDIVPQINQLIYA